MTLHPDDPKGGVPLHCTVCLSLSTSPVSIKICADFTPKPPNPWRSIFSIGYLPTTARLHCLGSNGFVSHVGVDVVARSDYR
jgi:hypothetical protein